MESLEKILLFEHQRYFIPYLNHNVISGRLIQQKNKGTKKVISLMKAASKLTSSLTDLECENIIDSRIYKNLQTHLNKPKEKM